MSTTTNNNATDLVLLHGWGMNNAVWDALPDGLDSRFRLHPIELPGHGEATFEPAWRDLPDWADAVLDQAPERAVWLGWSLGGLVASQAALQVSARKSGRRAERKPERIEALILVATTPRFVQSADWRAAMAESTFELFHGGLVADPRRTLQRFLSLQVRGSEDERETLKRLRAGIAARPLPRPEALRTGLDLLRDEDLRARLADIRLPTLWLFGERDTLVPPEVAERIALLMPDAICRTIPGAGHAPLLSHGKAALAEILEFLGGQPR